MPGEQLSENCQHIIAVQFALNMDSQALPAMLIIAGEHPERLAIMGAAHNEVVAPHMAAILWA